MNQWFHFCPLLYLKGDTAEGPMHMRASFVGDNLAIGGFKEGSSALRPCRHCMTERN